MKIGFYDSGLGGTTILIEALKKINNCEFIYLADNFNAPYGIKDRNMLKDIIIDNVEKLVDVGCQIIVIACNTATAIGIEEVRKKFKNINIIGTEPAIKLAIDYFNELKLKKELDDKDKILLTATKLTLKEEKLNNLIIKYNNNYNIDKIDFQQFVKFAENLNYKEEEVYKYLNHKVKNKEEYKAIVLGCTHFPLFKKEINIFFNNNIKIFDSSLGVVNNLISKINNYDSKKLSENNKKNSFIINNNLIQLIMTNENLDYFNKFKSIILKNI